MIEVFSQILDFIYPPVCGVCKKLNENYLCNKCRKLLKENSIFGIDKYSNSLTNYLDEHLYVFVYKGIIRNLILNYKFNNGSYLYKTFVNFLLKDKNFVNKIKDYDVIIPVALHKLRENKRGYNQSGLIAEELSKKLKIHINKNVLYKVKNINPQSKLNKEEREKNIIQAYRIKNEKAIINKKILLVDDVFTTGSTAQECSKTIRKVNVEKIGILTMVKN